MIRGQVEHSRSQIIPIYSIMQTVIAVKLQHEAFKEHELMSRKRGGRILLLVQPPIPFMSQTNHAREYLLF